MIDPEAMKELTASIGKSSVSRILKVFLDETEDQLAQIKICLQSNRTNEIADIAHSLKSTSATFGAKELHDIAFQIELVARSDSQDDLRILIKPLTLCVESLRPLYRPYTD